MSRAALVSAFVLSSCVGATASAASSQAKQPSPSTTTPSRPSTTVTIAPEALTPGDIPDTIAYIRYTNAAGRYSFSHPEGWAQTGRGTQVTFSDKYNGVSADSVLASSAPTPATARAVDVPKLKAAQAAFQLRSVVRVSLPAGSGVLIIYRRNSPPDVVTGKSVRQEVQRFEIFARGRLIKLDLYGAVGADNVDPYTRMSRSLS